MNAWRALMDGPPGRRFARYHARVQTRSSYLTMAMGLATVLLGLLLTLTPGPGFLVLLIGAAIIAGQSRRLARALDRAELRLRRAVRVFRRRGS